MTNLDAILSRRNAVDVAFRHDDSSEWCQHLHDADNAVWEHASPDSVSLLQFFINDTGSADWMNLPMTPEWFQEGNPEFYVDILTTLAIAECNI